MLSLEKIRTFAAENNKDNMKRKLLSLLVLLTVATGAWAENNLYLVFDPSDNTTATLMYGIVKSGEGVVLKSNTGSITLTPTIATADYKGNSLVGTTASIENPGNAYVLNKGSQGVGFYKLADGKTIGANKAYLTYDGGKGVKQFFLFDEATGIEAIDNGQLIMDNGQLIMDNGQLIMDNWTARPKGTLHARIMWSMTCKAAEL